MNHLIAIVIFLFSSLVCRAAEESGWNKVRWGMTAQQIAQVYPEARALPKPETYEPEGRAFTASLGIERFDLAGAIYNVRFLMGADNALGGVILGRNDTISLATDEQTLERLLTQKYGQPSVAKDTENGGRSVTWTSPGVTITLNHLAAPRIRSFYLRLIYLRPDTKALDKL